MKIYNGRKEEQRCEDGGELEGLPVLQALPSIPNPPCKLFGIAIS
jgi:hypothetical protein